VLSAVCGSSQVAPPGPRRAFRPFAKDARIVRRSVARSRRSGGALRQWLGCIAANQEVQIVEESGTGRVLAWFGVGSGSRRAKPERAQQFEQADQGVVEAFADLHEARRLRSNPAISPGAVQRFERKAWNRLIDYLMKLPPLPSDD
jgi:hypothetical protein